jgi:hypothetical protein
MSRRFVLAGVTFCIALLMVLICETDNAFPSEGYPNEKITDNVESQFQMIVQLNHKWSECELEYSKEMLGIDGNVKAFLFSILNNDEAVGYVVANNNIRNNIIEYGENDFFTIAEEDISEIYNISIDNQTLYYLGGISYAIGGMDNEGNIRYFQLIPNDYPEIEEEQWRSLTSPPDDGSDFITNPFSYESGYDAYYSRNVYNYNLTYFKMTQFSSGYVCAPTAATNLMFYWYNRGTYYDRLKYLTAWYYTFDLIKTYMNTSLTDGTSDSMLVTGYSNFLSFRGYTSSVVFHSGTSSGTALIPEINADRPCHLVVHSHSMYEDHSVLALGYQQFVYYHWYGDSYETYIRIADGWTSSANRFVWGNCSGTWNYVTVTIN